jgi:hypothetical protein
LATRIHWLKSAAQKPLLSGKCYFSNIEGKGSASRPATRGAAVGRARLDKGFDLSGAATIQTLMPSYSGTVFYSLRRLTGSVLGNELIKYFFDLLDLAVTFSQTQVVEIVLSVPGKTVWISVTWIFPWYRGVDEMPCQPCEG